ncbi:NACHT domain-containing protein [Streptomyces sp. NPDC056627]|uniref:serine protease n=1 Tax=Streptomyces sp. NPDC056627 TaxID=3345881 RepID=UPI0009628532|nr:serine protease [Streptomyces sp. CB02058]OKI91796.1 ATP-binding protein [Streptomyces sp. CB02058]
MSLLQPADRTVVVSGALQGSGVLLTDRLVLTCAHVVKRGSRCYLAHPALSSRLAASVVWIDHDLDAALLQTGVPVIEADPVRLGLVDTRQAIYGCEITGFPRIQRYGAEKRAEADQYTATVLPMAGRLRRLLVCDLDQPPPVRPDEEPSVLSGLSGGPVFAGDVLLGIARQAPMQRGGRRVECVPLGPVLSATAFRLVYEQTGPRLRHESVRGHFPEDLRYEEGYATSVGAAYRRTKIFGLDELGRHDSEWDLDTAYLSLEAQPRSHSPLLPPSGPQRVDALLADRRRVLLRGDAGAGKTTLLWWLAAHTSARTLSDALEPLNGLVPFVVPLRTLRARGSEFPGPAQLSGAAGLVVDRAPDGWAGRVLESGRALLLVDGLDEVPPEEREQAHAWLSQFLLRYPDTRCVATVRPLAVEPDWLGSEGFEELRLLPMRNEDIQSFVASWHRAARLVEDEEDHERLGELEQDLSRQFAQNSTLRDLARTPLLCAVICALHRRREGFLPETRWQLYRSALEMLLGNRDRRRRIERPEGIVMDIEEHTQLLQRIAVWLVREGQSEFTREQALRQLDRALPGMGRVSAQGSADKILTHLLNRSGLLQEHTDDTYQFAHRTFQDFLAAKELVEDDHLGELLRHTGEEQWQDVILLAAGHCGRRELPVLVEGLLDAGLTHEKGSQARTDIHVLAALCEQHATWLDEAVRERVRESTAALFPPADNEKVSALARLGTAALAFLPNPQSVTSNAPATAATGALIGSIGGAEALPHARAWALEHPSLGASFVIHWQNFPAQPYAKDVLAHCDLLVALVTVDDSEYLRALRHVPSVTGLLLTGDAPDAEFQKALGNRPLTFLTLQGNPSASDLSWLGGSASSLSYLRLDGCPAVQDLAPLTELSALILLELDASHLPPERLAPLAHLTGLTHLTLTGLAIDRLSELPDLPSITSLTIECRRPLALDGLDGWPSLDKLEVSEIAAFEEALAALRAHPHVQRVTFNAFPWPSGQEPVPSITDLTVHVPPPDRGLALLRPLFPSLTRLALKASAYSGTLDLTPLHSWPDLQVAVSGRERHDPLLVGAEELGDRITIDR